MQSRQSSSLPASLFVQPNAASLLHACTAGSTHCYALLLTCCVGLQDADESHAAVLSSLLHLPEAFAPQEHNRIKQHNSSVQKALASQDVKVHGGGLPVSLCCRACTAV
jgi:hypothetical protein